MGYGVEVAMPNLSVELASHFKPAMKSCQCKAEGEALRVKGKSLLRNAMGSGQEVRWE